jgi:hypothetical protein
LGINCAVCENVIQSLEKVVQSNESSTKLASDLTTVCSFLGVSTWCNTNLKPKLISLLPKLKSKTNPTTLCKSLKFCRNSTKAPKPPKPSKTPRSMMMLDEVDLSEKFSVTCEVCQAVLTYAKNQAGTNVTQAAIQNALNKACNALPFARDVCQQILLPYVTMIVQGFISQQDPLQICEKIKVCKMSDMDMEDMEGMEDEAAIEVAQVKRGVEGTVRCDVCTAVLTYVKNFVGSNNTQAAIQKAMDKACSKIPFAKGFCPLADRYITQIVEGIVAKQDPDQICQKIKLCASAIYMDEDEDE